MVKRSDFKSHNTKRREIAVIKGDWIILVNFSNYVVRFLPQRTRISIALANNVQSLSVLCWNCQRRLSRRTWQFDKLQRKARRRGRQGHLQPSLHHNYCWKCQEVYCLPEQSSPPITGAALIWLFTGSIARSASRRYLVYSEADFEVFRPAGATGCTNGGEIWHRGGALGPLLHAKFHPHRCNDNGVGPKNWNFYSDLTKMWNINASQGRIPCAIFDKICRLCTPFRMR